MTCIGGPAPGPAPQDLRATERDAELPSLSQEDALRCFPQAGSLKFGCVHDYSNIHAETVTAGTDILALRKVQTEVDGGYRLSILAFIVSVFDSG
jgi:hypothetical protein